MKRSEWSDSEIEQMLKTLPQLKDHRNSHEIYRNISSHIKKKKRTTWVVPSLASAGAAALFLFLGATFFNTQDNLSLDKSGRNASVTENSALKTDSADGKNESATAIQQKEIEEVPTEKSAKPETPEEPEEKENSSVAGENDGVKKSLTVQESEAKRFTVSEGTKYVTIALPDPNALGIVVPISMVLEDDGRTAAEAFKEAVTKITQNDYDKWGLAPLAFDSVVAVDEVPDDRGGKKVVIDVGENPNLSASAEGEAFKDSVIEAFRWNDYSSIEFVTEGNEGAILANTEVKKEDLKIEEKRAYYEYMFDQDYPIFLVPSREDFKTFNEAVESMESENFSQEAPLHAPIPGGVDIIGVAEKDENVTVNFSNDSGITEDNPVFIRMLDSILLTAKEFGFGSVTFTGAENEGIKAVGDIPFGSPVPVPEAPNPMQIP